MGPSEGPRRDEIGWTARRLERGRLTRSDLALEGGLPAEVARFVGVEGLSVVLGHGHALLLGLGQGAAARHATWLLAALGLYAQRRRELPLALRLLLAPAYLLEAP